MNAVYCFPLLIAVPFSLSFSPDFFYGTDDPNDIECSQQPVSVLQAIVSLRAAQRREIAQEVFGCESANLCDEMILQRVLETDTCTDLTPPVEVWIDEKGFHAVLVHDAPLTH